MSATTYSEGKNKHKPLISAISSIYSGITKDTAEHVHKLQAFINLNKKDAHEILTNLYEESINLMPELWHQAHGHCSHSLKDKSKGKVCPGCAGKALFKLLFFTHPKGIAEVPSEASSYSDWIAGMALAQLGYIDLKSNKSIYNWAGAEAFDFLQKSFDQVFEDYLEKNGVSEEIDQFLFRLLTTSGKERTPSDFTEALAALFLEDKFPEKENFEPTSKGFILGGFTHKGKKGRIIHYSEKCETALYVKGGSLPVRNLDKDISLKLDGNVLIWTSTKEQMTYKLIINDKGMDSFLRLFFARIITGRNNTYADKYGTPQLPGKVDNCTIFYFDDEGINRDRMKDIFWSAGFTDYHIFGSINECIKYRDEVVGRTKKRVIILADLGGVVVGGEKLLGITTTASPNETDPGPALELLKLLKAKYKEDLICPISRLFTFKALKFADENGFDYVTKRDFGPGFSFDLREIADGSVGTHLTTSMAWKVMRFYNRMTGRGGPANPAGPGNPGEVKNLSNIVAFKKIKAS